MNEEPRDERLWKLARRRADFRKSVASYFVVNGFLWCIWWFTQGHDGNFRFPPWPVWPMLGWGIGLAFQYFNAYGNSKEDLTEQEYRKLKKQSEE